MSDSEPLRAAILQGPTRVIDPETGVDIVRMRLIEDLAVGETRRVSYSFRPSSAVCPIAVPLAIEIRRAARGAGRDESDDLGGRLRSRRGADSATSGY